MQPRRSILGTFLRSIAARVDRPRLPQASGTLRLPGLGAPAEVLRDRWGVAHIYARDAHDLYLAQGFVHAQDRLWQMELNRRTATGRLSELFGKLALDTDRAARTFGWARLGRADWANAIPSVRDAIMAYTAGVNAYLAGAAFQTQRPVEFSLLRHRPEPWQPEDSMAFSRLMISQMSHGWYGEVVRAQLVEAVGAEHAAELEPEYPRANPVTLPAGIEFNRIEADGRLKPGRGPFLNQGLGSNSWVLAGSRTDTGHPILSNDMHLALSLPGLWYLVHLTGGDVEVSGVSLPGVPMVLVGHNAQIAWGMTLAYTDCEDLFVERFAADDPASYEFRGELRAAEIVTEEIGVKGSDPHVEKVVITHHGPVVSDVVGGDGERLALQSMALRPCPALEGWWRLNLARGWDDFVQAMGCIQAPQLNVAYADVQGNVGHWVTGKVPVRSAGLGLTPAPGWTGAHEWVGEVPFEEMPHALNPAEGVLVSCNHKLIGDDYPHYLGSMWMNGYRARRIGDVLAGLPAVSVEDCRALHVDVTCLPGRELVQRLAGFEPAGPGQRHALELLRAWDGRLDTGSTGGTVYEVLRYSLLRGILEPALGAGLVSRWAGKGFHPLLMSASELYGHDTTVLLRLLDRADSWWVAQAGGREAWLRNGLALTVDWLTQRLGPDPAGWQWGKLHHATFGHALGLQPPLGLVFSRGPFPIGGDTDTPCQTAMLPDEPYDNKAWSPSFRQIVDLGDLSRSWVIAPPGQSGRLASPHYDDLVAPWLRGELLPMLWARSDVERETAARLELAPGDGP